MSYGTVNKATVIAPNRWLIAMKAGEASDHRAEKAKKAASTSCGFTGFVHELFTHSIAVIVLLTY